MLIVLPHPLSLCFKQVGTEATKARESCGMPPKHLFVQQVNRFILAGDSIHSMIVCIGMKWASVKGVPKQGRGEHHHFF